MARSSPVSWTGLPPEKPKALTVQLNQAGRKVSAIDRAPEAMVSHWDDQVGCPLTSCSLACFIGSSLPRGEMAHLFLPDCYLDRNISYQDINPCISCTICNGYLINATTVIECLHTFCKSCLVKHLQEKNTCPKCNLLIHQSHPLSYISYDRTMADIVNKLAPHLICSEAKREADFYKKRGLTCPKLIAVASSSRQEDVASHIDAEDGSKYDSYSNNLHTLRSPLTAGTTGKCGSVADPFDTQCGTQNLPKRKKMYMPTGELISLQIESHASSGSVTSMKKYLLCSAHTTVTQLRKFIAKRLFNDSEQFAKVDLLCNGHLLGKEHSLKYVYVTHWRYNESHLSLVYKTKLTDK